MTDQALIELAQAAGIAPRWRDAYGRMHDVAPTTLRLVLAALGVQAESDAAVRFSLAQSRAAAAAALAPLITADADQPLPLAGAPAGAWRIALEGGGIIEGRTESGATLILPAIAEPGYHVLHTAAGESVLAVAPARCHGIRDADPAGRLWGLAVQLYALRRAGDGGIGDFAALRDFVGHAARAGADAVAISPIHAQFSADLDRFSPYSPSSRVHYNVLHADADDLLAPDPATADLETLALVDWPRAARARLTRFRAAYAALAAQPSQALAAEFAAFKAQRTGQLMLHARFEALHAHQFGANPARWNWRSWPAALRDPTGPAVAAFAADHAPEVDFHAFLQFLADRGLAAAQHAAHAAGMKIGLIADLAVGTDGGGSHAWARQSETLLGLSVGAPPDILSHSGQDWGLAAFSPTGLVQHGFAAYLEMLRAALRHAGGVRIDHVMGLARLWVLPEGAPAREGAYLHFPHTDLLRLIALESQRHRAIILGEDLGTVPDGFQNVLDARRLMGLRVLWFEADGDRFRPPGSWTANAAAMTSTHDLPTVAGWWRGLDLDRRRALGLLGDDTGIWHAYENRARERPQLWQAMTQSGAAAGPIPANDAPAAAVDAAVGHIGRAGCELALLPIEDALGLAEQPNLPGTIDQHPNWRRRLAGDAAAVFADPALAARLHVLALARRPPES